MASSRGIIGQHRKHRTEDFLLHYCIPEGYIIHNSRSDLKSYRIVVTAADYLAGIDQIADTSKVLFINNFPIILIIQRCGTKLFPDLFLDLSDQFILDFSVAVNIIRCYTGLTTVEIFSNTILLAASFRFALFSTMQGLLPPSSRVTGVRCTDAFAITSLPTCWLPVKKI